MIHASVVKLYQEIVFVAVESSIEPLSQAYRLTGVWKFSRQSLFGFFSCSRGLGTSNWFFRGEFGLVSSAKLPDELQLVNQEDYFVYRQSQCLFFLC